MTEERSGVSYFDLNEFVSLQDKVRAAGADDDLEVIRDAVGDCLNYVRTVCEGENLLNTLAEADRATVGDYDSKRHNAHENAISSVSMLNRLAQRYGVSAVFLGDIADRHQVADFCLEAVEWLFNNRRRVL